MSPPVNKFNTCKSVTLLYMSSVPHIIVFTTSCPTLQECHPEWLFSESKFLKPESLVELVKVSVTG